jgi:hypothetical protein
MAGQTFYKSGKFPVTGSLLFFNDVFPSFQTFVATASIVHIGFLRES